MNPRHTLDWISGVVARFNVNPDEVDAKLSSFRNLQNGWHRGLGKAFSSKMVNTAKEVHAALRANAFKSTDAFPGFHGEIQIVAHESSLTTEFTLGESGEWNVVFVVDDEDCFELGGLETTKVVQLISTLRENLWFTSSYSPRRIGTPPNDVLLPLPSSRPTRMEEYRASIRSVLRPEIRRYVDTFESSTQTWQASPRSFGVYKAPFYQTPSNLLTNRAPQETCVTETFGE